MVVDHFSKWVEAEALASITPVKIKEFIYKNIIYRYGVPHTIISNNGTHFDCDEFKKTTLRSKRFSHRSHDLKPMGKSKL